MAVLMIKKSFVVDVGFGWTGIFVRRGEDYYVA